MKSEQNEDLNVLKIKQESSKEVTETDRVHQIKEKFLSQVETKPKPKSKEKKYMCPFCTEVKILPSKFDLTEHCSQVHEGKKIYFCLLCEACFGCKVTLSNHMTRYHSKSIVWCPKCDLGFLCVSHLDRHLLMYHEKNVDIGVNMIATSSDKFKKIGSELLLLEENYSQI